MSLTLLLAQAIVHGDAQGGGWTPVDPTFEERPFFDAKTASKEVRKLDGMPGYDDHIIPTSVIAYPVLEFIPVAWDVGIECETNRIATNGNSKVIVRVQLDSLEATINCRLIMYDILGVPMATEAFTLAASGLTIEGKSLCVSKIVDVYGANKTSLHVLSVSSGSADIWLAGV